MISEEQEAPPPAARRGWRRFWLVDPLDGTREFLAGRPSTPSTSRSSRPACRCSASCTCRGPATRMRPRPASVVAPAAQRAARPPGDRTARSRRRAAHRREPVAPVVRARRRVRGYDVRERIPIGSSLKFGLLAGPGRRLCPPRADHGMGRRRRRRGVPPRHARRRAAACLAAGLQHRPTCAPVRSPSASCRCRPPSSGSPACRRRGRAPSPTPWSPACGPAAWPWSRSMATPSARCSRPPASPVRSATRTCGASASWPAGWRRTGSPWSPRWSRRTATRGLRARAL